MLPILRSRPSQVLVALLCALVLSRVPAPVCGEDAISTLVKVEDSAALAVVAAPNIDVCVCASAIAVVIQHSAGRDASNYSPIEYSVLRL